MIDVLRKLLSVFVVVSFIGLVGCGSLSNVTERNQKETARYTALAAKFQTEIYRTKTFAIYKLDKDSFERNVVPQLNIKVNYDQVLRDTGFYRAWAKGGTGRGVGVIYIDVFDTPTAHGIWTRGIGLYAAPFATQYRVELYLDEFEMILDQSIVDAYTFILDHPEKFDVPIQIINQSWGGLSFDHYCDGEVADAPYGKLLQRALDNNIIIVNSAGNGANKDGLVMPSCMKDVIPVAASWAIDEDEIPELVDGINFGNCAQAKARKFSTVCFTDIAPFHRNLVVAFGMPVKLPTTVFFAGTSASAPLVTSAIALIRSVFPDLPREEIVYLLQAYSDRAYEMYQGYREYPQLNIGKVFAKLLHEPWRESIHKDIGIVDHNQDCLIDGVEMFAALEAWKNSQYLDGQRISEELVDDLMRLWISRAPICHNVIL